MSYKVLFSSVAILISSSCLAAENFTIYLTRHAEKQNSLQDKNPTLTRCGKLRAQQLASLLSEAKLVNIYSTSYQRTMQTALPTASSQKKSIKNYNPKYLEQLAFDLKLKRENALVVGHSNTTPFLAELLSDEKVAAMKESHYQVLYQIQFIDDKKVLTQLTQPLVCRS